MTGGPTTPAALGVAAASRALEEGRVSAEELVRDCLRQAYRYAYLNAFITLTEDTAVAEARASDARRRSGRPRGPLDGLPVAVKDIFDVAGVPTTAGSAFPAPEAEADAAVAARLRAAGAVMLGKAHTHEWALGTTSDNVHFGPARNPWNPDRIPGGSSGGSAAGLAARMFPAALGSDTGGSIRIPAALCGVTGLKPTRGRVSLRGVAPLSWTLDHAGPMARSVTDVALLLDVVAGYDPEDPASRELRQPAGGFARSLEAAGDTLSAFRIGVPPGYFWGDRQIVTPAAVAAAREAIGVLRGARAVVVDLPPFDWDAASRANGRILLSDAAAVHAERLAREPDGYGPDVRRRLESGAALPGVKVAAAHRAREVWRRRMDAIFESVDVIATPTTSIAAHAIGDDGVRSAASLTALTSPFNLTGLPALSVPCGFDEAGMPVGLQLVAAAGREELALRAGAAYQRRTDWHERRPPLG